MSESVPRSFPALSQAKRSLGRLFEAANAAAESP